MLPANPMPKHMKNDQKVGQNDEANRKANIITEERISVLRKPINLMIGKLKRQHNFEIVIEKGKTIDPTSELTPL